jgi:hypothetical protein
MLMVADNHSTSARRRAAVDHAIIDLTVRGFTVGLAGRGGDLISSELRAQDLRRPCSDALYAAGAIEKE